MREQQKNGESEERENSIKSVALSFEIIECLYRLCGAGVSEVADQLDIPNSTAHVHLQTLVSNGYVIQNGNKYRIGLQFLRIGGGTRSNLELYQAAKSELNTLAKKTEEVTDLLIEEQGEGVLLYTAEGEQAIDDNTPIGAYVPLHTTAVGKAILAYLPEQRVNTIIANHGLDRYTPNTITSRTALFDELAEIREQGFVYNNEERSRGVRAVGTPILRKEDNVVGAISITGPVERMSDERVVDELLDPLLRSRNIIELKISHY